MRSRLFRPVALLALIALLALAACSRPMPRQQAVAPPRPVVQREQVTIVVDAGHGGHDKGAHSTKPQYQEKRLALATSFWLRDQLQRMGYRVVMTRSSDVFIELPDRAQIANEASANLFVSVHFNSSPNGSADGIEVFYYAPNKPAEANRSRLSKQFAEQVVAQVTQATSARSRGAKEGDWAVLRKTHMPAILVEGGFLTHAAERKLLLTPEYLKKLAWGMAQGIDSYVQQSQLPKSPSKSTTR